MEFRIDGFPDHAPDEYTDLDSIAGILFSSYLALKREDRINPLIDSDIRRIREKFSQIQFSDYWADLFEKFKVSNSDVVGHFSHRIFQHIEKYVGNDCLIAIAEELGSMFPFQMFSANFDVPDVEIDKKNSPDLKKFLIDLRNSFKQQSSKFPPFACGSLRISVGWLKLAAHLAINRPKKHAEIFREVESASRSTQEFWNALLNQDHPADDGKSSVFRRNENIAVVSVVAKILAKHFPEIVVSQLLDLNTEMKRAFGPANNTISTEARKVLLDRITYLTENRQKTRSCAKDFLVY